MDERLLTIQPSQVEITSWRVHSIRGYDVAREFRKPGLPVFMGGPHVWFHPEEVAEHLRSHRYWRSRADLGADAY